MIIKKYVLGPVQTNCYLLVCEKTKKAAVIDPGEKCAAASQFISENSFSLALVINTHGHFDHIGGNRFFCGENIPLASHRLEFERIKTGGDASFFGLGIDKSPEPSIDLSERDIIDFGETSLRVIHTPGHTRGHISLYHMESGSLFCGDVLFFRSIGRSDLPGGSQKELLESIREKLFRLPDDTAVYPGHGPYTTIGDEKKYNPWAAV